MKYYTWKFVWSNNEGTDPTAFVNNDNCRLEPFFANGDIKNLSTLTYGYLLKGIINVELLTAWSVKEITIEEMLNAALKINSEAIIENEIIKFPTAPNRYEVTAIIGA